MAVELIPWAEGGVSLVINGESAYRAQPGERLDVAQKVEEFAEEAPPTVWH